jgi:hypothetical protein
LIPLILLLFPSPAGAREWIPLYWVVGWYVIAKLFDRYDCAIYSLSGVLSGHTLKHLAGAIATWYIVKMFRQKHCFRTGFKKKIN